MTAPKSSLLCHPNHYALPSSPAKENPIHMLVVIVLNFIQDFYASTGIANVNCVCFQNIFIWLNQIAVCVWHVLLNYESFILINGVHSCPLLYTAQLCDNTTFDLSIGLFPLICYSIVSAIYIHVFVHCTCAIS